MKFKSALSIIFFSATLAVSSANDFTNKENIFIQNILDFRLSLRALATDDQVISAVRDFRTVHAADIGEFGEEAQLVCYNMLATAEYNAFYAKDMHAPEMEGILRPQYKKITAYTAAHPVAEQNPWFTMTSADIINSMMQFLKQSEAIKLGLQEKKDYAAVIEKHPQMSFALMLNGFWYYYAPKVGGGSKAKAKSFFTDALTYAANDYERYYAAINLAQCCFEEKNTAECAHLLAQAERVLPATRYVAFIRTINALGYSLFDYNMNSTRKKLDARLAEEK